VLGVWKTPTPIPTSAIPQAKGAPAPARPSESMSTTSPAALIPRPIVEIQRAST
jgi:hypothetical protein